ncbi:DUF418 domain-containing protein [Altererythrobacter salegens]|uniref:DUF418 domain-containing protein n=1 Tax=Croceibacterium salegens TaxID=1737568 RepID=A0A6I4SS63_9SPHN|nr:DUF418 domain-containing protein [Croceibacterium salegens]MXO58764.1 DUF418 domain-containing protein [Croceibacterium salegens]
MATTSPDRILTLDVIRGIAVMGIFSVNVVGMAMIESAYFYPPDYGFDHGYDKLMWALNSVFVDGRWRSLFSILFGASTILVIERGVAAGKKGWQVHFPRMIVLLAFGLLHFYFLWWGDILANYAMVGMIAYVFWRLDKKWLLLASLAVLAFINVGQLVEAIPQLQMVERVQAGGGTQEEQEKVEKLLAPDPDLAKQIAQDKADHASIPARFEASTKEKSRLEPFEGVIGYGIETLGLMLLGMAAYKSGFLTGGWSRRSYWIVVAACLVPDLALHAYGAITSVNADFDPVTYFPWTRMYVNPLHPVGAMGYAALIILLLGHRSAISDRLAAVGRAAFTNYLSSTIIGTLVFYGTFGGLYGQLSRGQAWLLVPVVWTIMLLWSKWWLDRYRYGPFEWVWRSLSRWEVQPMRKRVPVAA